MIKKLNKRLNIIRSYIPNETILFLEKVLTYILLIISITLGTITYLKHEARTYFKYETTMYNTITLNFKNTNISNFNNSKTNNFNMNDSKIISSNIGNSGPNNNSTIKGSIKESIAAANGFSHFKKNINNDSSNRNSNAHKNKFIITLKSIIQSISYGASYISDIILLLFGSAYYIFYILLFFLPRFSLQLTTLYYILMKINDGFIDAILNQKTIEFIKKKHIPEIAFSLLAIVILIKIIRIKHNANYKLKLLLSLIKKILIAIPSIIISIVLFIWNRTHPLKNSFSSSSLNSSSNSLTNLLAKLMNFGILKRIFKGNRLKGNTSAGINAKYGEEYDTKYDKKTRKSFALSSQSAPLSSHSSQQKSHNSFHSSLKNTEKSLPPLSLLKENHKMIEYTQDDSKFLLETLNEFGVKGKIVSVNYGPVITLYEFTPSAGTKSARVIGLSDDIARSISAVSTRIAIIPGKNAIGIEVPNKKRLSVFMRDIVQKFSNNQAIPLALGYDITGNPITVDLAKMPHLLVAGTTGSGKSVSINSMIISILYKFTHTECKFIMIDPKMLELSIYQGIPHLLSPVITEPKKAISALKWAVQEMEKRYRIMSQFGVRNLQGYNELIEKKPTIVRKVEVGFDSEGKQMFEEQIIEGEKLPFIVVIIDEMADLMLVAGKEVEITVQRLAQMARAAGIHLIMATQRPSVDVITGTIKANFPTRVSFQMSSSFDSKTILGERGAEQLLGAGDMLYMSSGGVIRRLHGPFVSDAEVEKVVEYIKNMHSTQYVMEFDEDFTAQENQNSVDTEKDPLYEQAVEIIRLEGKVSTSYIQRKLEIGYNRAAKIVETMESEGVVSKPNKMGRREIL